MTPKTQAEFARRTYEPRAATYEDSWHTAYSPVFVGLLQLRPGDRVLSLCCGTGLDAFAAAAAIGPAGHVVGIDVSEAMLNVARARRAASDDQVVRLICHDATDLGSLAGEEAALVQPGGFDAVVCSNALFMFEDPAAVVRHWRDYLKPGGVLAVDIPHEGNMLAGLVMERSARQMGLEYTHRRAWIKSKASLQEILEREGYTVDKVVEVDKVPGRRSTYFTVDQADGQFDYMVNSDPKVSALTKESKTEMRPVFREEFSKIAVDGKAEMIESLYIYIARWSVNI